MSLSMKSFLSDALVLDDVRSEKYPDGKSYSIPEPDAKDEVLLHDLVLLEDRIGEKAAGFDLTQGDDEDDDAYTERLKAFTDEMTPLREERDHILDQFNRDADGNKILHEKKVLGSAYAEMVADGVRPRHLEQLAQIVVTNYGKGENAARGIVMLAAGEAQARANRAARRAAAKKKSSPRKAGSSSRRTSGAASTRTGRANTRGSATSARKTPAAKTA